MKSFKQVYQLNASTKEVFTALTDSKIIEKWSGSAAIMDNKIGSEFNLWDGFIYGTNTEVLPNKKLVQDWYGGQWEKPSKVTFDMQENPDGTTTLTLTHENVPENTEHDFEIGWRKYYIGKMIDMFSQMRSN